MQIPPCSQDRTSLKDEPRERVRGSKEENNPGASGTWS